MSHGPYYGEQRHTASVVCSGCKRRTEVRIEPGFTEWYCGKAEPYNCGTASIRCMLPPAGSRFDTPTGLAFDGCTSFTIRDD